jgi:hypothetical protein
VTKIPIRIEDIEKVPSASEEIKNMLRTNQNVSFDSDVPYCYLSRLESSYGELTIGCNLKNMVCLIYSTKVLLLYLFTRNGFSSALAWVYGLSCYLLKHVSKVQ